MENKENCFRQNILRDKKKIIIKNNLKVNGRKIKKGLKKITEIFKKKKKIVIKTFWRNFQKNFRKEKKNKENFQKILIV
jgi:hypothetical protein